MKLEKVLCIVLLLILSVSGTLNAEEKSAPKRSVEDAEIAFGKSTVDRFEEMFQSGDFDFKAYGNRGVTVLHYAVLMNDQERVKLLIEKGADVNARDNNDATPLIVAADNNNWELIKILVENGADVNAQNRDGDNAMFNTALSGNLEMVQYLTEKGADITVKSATDNILLWAARSGNLELVQWLVNQGISVSKSNGALHYAVSSGNLELVQWLVEHGADVNDFYFNDSVLAYAVDSNYPEILRYLVEEAGVDVNDFINRKIDYTALEKAVKNNNFEFVKFLVEHGANINPRIILESYPLPYWYALGNADPEIVQYLRERDNLLKALGVLALIILAFSLFIIYKLLRRKTIRVE